MNQQIDLLQTSDPSPNKYKLFLAIFPDADTAGYISEQAVVLRDKFGLRGKLRPRDHLHVTLRHFGDFPAVPEQMIQDVSRACAAILAGKPSFEVTFDHVMSFRRRANPPFVLINPNGNAALLEFHRLLITGLAKHWVAGIAESKFFPHITMLYDKQEVSKQSVHPVSWMVREAVLVLSHVGATKYDRLGRWALRA
jgi:RNA 2',3'-cyclic 3'-phosphodiesterase